MAKIKQLILDQGNTRCKGAIAIGDKLERLPNETDVSDYLRKLNLDEFTSVILSSSAHLGAEALVALEKHPKFILLTSETKLPIEIDYNTPKTLGADRRANACGLQQHRPEGNSLAIDIGTCITYDLLIDGKTFVGGCISPGAQLRNQSMNNYTTNLPLVDLKKSAALLGKDTLESLQSGILNGMNAEIHGMIARFRSKYAPLDVFITGGGADHFDMASKNFIFADANLTLRGLHSILQLNEQ